MGVENTIRKVFNLPNFSLKSQGAKDFADNIESTYFEFPGQDPLTLTQQELQNVKLYLRYTLYEGTFGNNEVVQLSQTALFLEIIKIFSENINRDKEIAKLEETCKITGNTQKCKDASQKERNRLKFTFYSAHDTNIVGISKFLGLGERDEAPPYASTFFFKLLSKEQQLTGEPDDYLVYIEFNDGVDLSFGSFPQFESFVSDRIYQGDLSAACNHGIPKESKVNKWQIIVIVIVAVLVLLGIVIGVYCFCKRRKSRQEFPLHQEIDREPTKHESRSSFEMGNPFSNP